MPAWIDNGDSNYGVPDVEERGFKLGIDPPETPFDPDTGDRTVGEESVARARVYLKKRFPALAEAPLVEARVCQYEDTPSGDFLIDRHPDFENVWLAGGGSGHGFKLGPAVGEYVAGRVLADERARARHRRCRHRDPLRPRHPPQERPHHCALSHEGKPLSQRRGFHRDLDRPGLRRTSLVKPVGPALLNPAGSRSAPPAIRG